MNNPRPRHETGETMRLVRLAAAGRLAAALVTVAVGMAPGPSGAAPVGEQAPLRQAPLRQAPRPLKPAAHGVGRLVPAVAFTDVEGRRHAVGMAAESDARQPAGDVRAIRSLTVFAFTSTSCPLSRKYLPTLAAVAHAAPPQVRFVLVCPTATDDVAALRQARSQLPPSASAVHDATGTLARALGGLTTTDVVVVDDRRTVVYHGAIDDQYGFGYALDAPRHTYLADALAALVAGRLPAVAATNAPGCEFDVGHDATAMGDLTYHGRIARIMLTHCVECHRAGGVGPFPLDTHDDVVAHAAMIRTVVERGVMPPWFAAPPERDDGVVGHSPWANDRSLTAADKADLLAWLTSDRPVGDPADAPAAREFPAEWRIGTPDAVWEFAEPVAVNATGTMPYQYVIIETNLPENRWVTAIEVRPGSPEVVHHVLVHVEAGEDAAAGDAAADVAGRTTAGRPRQGVIARLLGRPPSTERGGFWAASVPGQSVLEYPDGFAKFLPKNARLHFQMHYTPNGTATTDRTRIGVVFATEPPRHEVRVAGLANRRIAIPPGEPRHEARAEIRIPTDVAVLGFLPHMHVRGTACRYDLVRPDGTAETLLDIPRYDFNWQLLYRCREPRPLTAGDRLRFTAWFDNSDGNPANPDPTRTVHWGPQTFDEMLLGYVEYYVPAAQPSRREGLP
jgi:mono/diheme cytochrome c family protein